MPKKYYMWVIFLLLNAMIIFGICVYSTTPCLIFFVAGEVIGAVFFGRRWLTGNDV